MIRTVFWEDETTSEMVYGQLCKGSLILGDSDTVLGLYASVSPEGFSALNECKGRSEKPYLLLVAHVGKALSLIEAPVSASVARLMEHCWPGPLTLICKPRADLPSYVKGRGGQSIALRVPDHEGLRRLLELSGMLFSTSANLTGEPVPDSLGAVDRTIIESVSSCVLNKYLAESAGTVASTILDCTQERVTLVREGAYPVSLIQSRAEIVIE